jgi:hypothetical protein
MLEIVPGSGMGLKCFQGKKIKNIDIIQEK